MNHWSRRGSKGYFVALAVAVGVMLIVGYTYSSTRAIIVTRTQNVARADSLKSDIAGLPEINSIEPAQTSGALDHVASARKQLAKSSSTYYPRYAFWLYGYNSLYYADAGRQRVNTSGIQLMAKSLDRTYRDLTNLKKLIEYMPLVDLSNLADDPVASDRLERTKRGLDESIEYIKQSNLDPSGTIAVKLTKLNSQTLKLTDSNKKDWANTLLDVQKTIIQAIADGDIQNGMYTKKLDAISKLYQ